MTYRFTAAMVTTKKRIHCRRALYYDITTRNDNLKLAMIRDIPDRVKIVPDSESQPVTVRVF